MTERPQREGWLADTAKLPARPGWTSVVPPCEYALSPYRWPPVDEGGRPADSGISKDGASVGGRPSKHKEQVKWRSRRRWLIGCPLD